MFSQRPTKSSPSPRIQKQADKAPGIPAHQPVHSPVVIQRAILNNDAITVRDVLQLQRAIGNQAVQRLLETPSAEREVSSDNTAERDAPVAITRSTSSPVISRKGEGEESKLIPTVTGEVLDWGFMELPEEQQAAPPAPAEWSADYKKKKSYIGESYDKYKSTIGKVAERPEIKSASAWGGKGKRVKTSISTDQLTRIISAAGEQPTTDRIAPMAGGISSAFATMGIDTAQAQAEYLAHMAGETGGVLEETQAEKRSYAPFQGRGTMQVTHEYNYVQTLAYMETRAEQLVKENEDKQKQRDALAAQKQAAPPAGGATPPDPAPDIAKLTDEMNRNTQQSTELRAAHAAIKSDQRMAADPRYSFVFSAAYMHMMGAVRSSANLGATAPFTGKGTEDSWVTGGNVQQGVAQADGSTKNVSMTFEERRQYAATHGLKTLESDMNSAISRGDKKSKVYGKAMTVLSAENALP